MLAADVRYYGRLIRPQRAQEKDRPPLPQGAPAEGPRGRRGQCLSHGSGRALSPAPNPAARGKHVPLISTYWLSSKKGSEAWLEPVVKKAEGTYRFEVHNGTPKDRTTIAAGTKNGKGGFRCLLTDAPIPFAYIRSEGQGGRLAEVMLAIVDLNCPDGVSILPASMDHVDNAHSATPSGFPDTDLPEEALGFRVQNYGIQKHWQMFTPRELTAMVTLSDLVKAIEPQIRRDGTAAELRSSEADAYSSIVATFLALAVDRCADYNNALSVWKASGQQQNTSFHPPDDFDGMGLSRGKPSWRESYLLA